MASHHGNTNRGSSNLDGRVIEDLLGFIDHLHFLLGIAVLHEDVDMGKNVQVDLIWIYHFAFYAISLIHHLVNSRLSRSGHRLVDRYHNSLDAVFFPQGCQSQNHLYGGTIRVGYDPVINSEILGIDLWDDQLFGWIHPPGG